MVLWFCGTRSAFCWSAFVWIRSGVVRSGVASSSIALPYGGPPTAGSPSGVPMPERMRTSTTGHLWLRGWQTECCCVTARCPRWDFSPDVWWVGAAVLWPTRAVHGAGPSGGVSGLVRVGAQRGRRVLMHSWSRPCACPCGLTSRGRDAVWEVAWHVPVPPCGSSSKGLGAGNWSFVAKSSLCPSGWGSPVLLRCLGGFHLDGLARCVYAAMGTTYPRLRTISRAGRAASPVARCERWVCFHSMAARAG